MSLGVGTLHCSAPGGTPPSLRRRLECKAGQLRLLGYRDKAPQSLASSLIGRMNINNTTQGDECPESSRRD